MTRLPDLFDLKRVWFALTGMNGIKTEPNEIPELFLWASWKLSS